jgi:endogenous inhibitor of DNA gyrase (YacG/DUF329 family)
MAAVVASRPRSEYGFLVASKCPTCGRGLTANAQEQEQQTSFRPFCSQRCRLADLGKWLDGAYRIGAPVTEEELDQGMPTEGDGDGDGKPQ